MIYEFFINCFFEFDVEQGMMTAFEINKFLLTSWKVISRIDFVKECNDKNIISKSVTINHERHGNIELTILKNTIDEITEVKVGEKSISFEQTSTLNLQLLGLRYQKTSLL
jgi:hypothetical protein